MNQIKIQSIFDYLTDALHMVSMFLWMQRLMVRLRLIPKGMKELRNAIPVAGVVAACLVLVALLVRNAALSSPIMGSDEYAYYTAARNFPNLSEALARNPYLTVANSTLLAAVGRAMFASGLRPDFLMKAANAVWFACSVLALLSALFVLGGRRLSVAAIMILCLGPFSAFSAYFMPETLFLFIYVSLLIVLLFVFPQNEWAGACLVGLCVGLLMMTKPHGIAILVSGVLTLLSLGVAPKPIRLPIPRLLALIAIFLLTTYGTYVGGNAALTGRLELTPLALIGPTYTPFLVGGISFSVLSDHFRQLASIAGVHIAILLLLCTPPLATAISMLILSWSKGGDDSQRPPLTRQEYILVTLTMLTTLIAFAMTVNFTLQVGVQDPTELARVHGRYYGYLIPQFFLVYYGLQGTRGVNPSTRLWWRVAGIVGLLSVACFLYLSRHSILYPWDYPDVFALSTWEGNTLKVMSWPLLAIAALAYGVMTWRGESRSNFYTVFLIALFLASDLSVTRWQFANARSHSSLEAQSQAVRTLLPENERDQGVIIGENPYGEMSYFLFNFASNAAVRSAPRGSQLTSAFLPSGAKWVILLDKYDAQFPVVASLDMGTVWFGQLTPGWPAVRERIALWQGERLELQFGDGLDSYLLEGFNPPEPWGAWSATDGARVMLPALLTGPVQIVLDGWTLNENLDQPFYLELGEMRLPMQLTSERAPHCATLDLQEPTSEIVLRGIEPYRRFPWGPSLGVALARLTITRPHMLDGISGSSQPECQ